MSKRPVQKQLFRMLMLSLAILLIGGGLALFYQWHQGPTPSQASSDSVVGQPSLPASLVDSIFRRLGSPMVGTGPAIEAAARAANIDDAFALAVWWTETNDGAAGVGLADRNPGSVRGSVGYPSAYDGYTIYPSYTAAVNYWFPMLKRVYIDRGLTTVSAISHPYVGTSTSYLWADKVIALMNRYRGEAPPTATPAPQPTTPAGLLRVQQALAAKAQQQAGSSTAPIVFTATPQQPVSQATTSGLGATEKLLLVLFDLLFALTLGLWARNASRRYASQAKPLVQPQPVGNLWEDLRASQQRPSAFFGQRSLSGLLGNTEGLSLNASAPDTARLVANAPYTDILGTTSPLQPVYRAPGAGFAPGSFITSQAQAQAFQTPRPTPAPSFNGQLPFDASAFTGQLSFGAPEPVSTEQLSFDAPAAPFTGQLSPSFDMPRMGYIQAACLPDQSTRTNIPASNVPHRTRLQSTIPGAGQFRPFAEAAVRQPQPVGAGASGGRSNGLLSRYREMQVHEERG